MTGGNLIADGVRYYPLWSKLASLDIGLRFRRSALGIIWLIIPSLVFAFGAGYVWANLFQQPPGDFIPFVALGFAIWGFISGVFTEGGGTFQAAQGYIRQVPIPLAVFVYRTAATQTLYFLISCIVGFATVLIFAPYTALGFAWGALVALVIAFGFSAVYVSAFLGARFRDFTPAVQSLMQVLFVLTPVIYPARILEERGLGFVAQFNPFAALIEIVRTPVITGVPAQPVYYLAAALMTLALMTLGIVLHVTSAKKVVFWL
jgi:ABC-type polysaccharide/polyol phosphate export permease